VPIYIGRGLHWLASGLVSSTIAYVILPFALGVPLPWPRAILGLPMLIVTSLSSYCYGCALGAVALRHMAVTWLILNVGYLTVMTFCGVNVPVSFWPAPIHALTQVMPITHGLQAIRDMLAGASAGTVLGQLGLEVVVGAGWLAVAAVAIDRVVKHGVATGSLEFGT
jgi:ABC-2 type transport system permease protein